MSLPRRALRATLPLAIAALRLPAGGAATPAADPGALSHCAAIVAADERLACYDSLARPKPSPAAAAGSAPASGKASPHAATAPGNKPTTTAAMAAAAPAAAAPATAAPATAGAATGPANSFGLTKHPAPTEEGPDHIRAQVTRVDPGRFGDVRVSLDNGQAWTFTGPDALIRVGDAVMIRRGALGSFLLTTPAHRTYKAQRSQ